MKRKWYSVIHKKCKGEIVVITDSKKKEFMLLCRTCLQDFQLNAETLIQNKEYFTKVK